MLSDYKSKRRWENETKTVVAIVETNDTRQEMVEENPKKWYLIG